MAKKNNPYNEEAVTELQLYTENDRAIYNSRLQPIYKNLAKKQKKGEYDPKKAQKLYRYAVDDGAKKYKQEFASQGDNIYTKADKDEVARRLEIENRDELKFYLPNK